MVGRVNVIISDADALWLGDPVPELFSDAYGKPLVSASGAGRIEILQSDVVASRGSFPFTLGKKWGSTMCMGFILFRDKNAAAMKEFLHLLESIVLVTRDDQV